MIRPGRTRRGTVVARRQRSLAAIVLTAAALAACTPPLPTPQPAAEPAAIQPAVSVEQVDEVLADVATTLETADAAQQAELLTPRVSGPAFTTRQAEYVLRVAGDAEAITPIPRAAQVIVAPTTREWPRTLVVVTEPPEDLQPPLLLTLVQESPREPYRLWSWARLFPGVEVPATAQPQVGSAPVEVEADSITVAPADVVAQYVDVLTSGADSTFAAGFTADPMRAGITALRDALSAGVDGKGSVTETYQAYDGGPYAMATADGGAIVVGAIQTLSTITLSDSTLTIGDQTASLLGKTTVSSNLAITWLSMVAFAVPPAGSTEPITVLGAEHSRIHAVGE